MPHVQVRYFGAITEITGKDQETFQHTGQVTNLVETLYSKYASLHAAHFQISVNFTIIHDNPKLNDGDEIALLPSFTGG